MMWQWTNQRFLMAASEDFRVQQTSRSGALVPRSSSSMFTVKVVTEECMIRWPFKIHQLTCSCCTWYRLQLDLDIVSTSQFKMIFLSGTAEKDCTLYMLNIDNTYKFTKKRKINENCDNA